MHLTKSSSPNLNVQSIKSSTLFCAKKDSIKNENMMHQGLKSIMVG